MSTYVSNVTFTAAWYLYETYGDAREHERAQEIREEIRETAAHQ